MVSSFSPNMSKIEKLIWLGGVPNPKRGEAATGLKVAKPKKSIRKSV